MEDKFGRSITVETTEGHTTYSVLLGAVVAFTVMVPQGTPVDCVLATIESMEPSDQ